MDDKSPENKDTQKKIRVQHSTPRKEVTEKKMTSDNVSQHIVKGKQNGTLKLLDGSSYPLTIPAPTEEDIEWAKECFEEDKNTRNEAASKAITDGNLWRLHFLLAVEKKQGNFIDIDCFGEKETDHTLLGHTALLDEGGEDFAALLISYGAKLDKGGNPRWAGHQNGRENTPIRAAVKNNRVPLIQLLLDNGARFYKDDFKEAKHYETQEYLIHRFENLGNSLDFADLNSNKTYDRDSKWDKVDDYTIAKTSNLPGRLRLTKTFNFLAHEIEKVTEVISNDDKTPNNVSYSSLSFDDLKHTDELEQAHEKLMDLKGKPKGLQHYIGKKKSR